MGAGAFGGFQCRNRARIEIGHEEHLLDRHIRGDRLLEQPDAFEDEAALAFAIAPSALQTADALHQRVVG